MNTNVRKLLFGDGRNKHPPVPLAVTPPRTGERTLLGVENLFQSIAVPDPSPWSWPGMWTAWPFCPVATTTRWCASSYPPTTPRPTSCGWRRMK